MRPAAQLIAEGRAAAPACIPTTAFLRANGAKSEADYKRRCRDARRVMFHMHVGLSTWEATADALRTVHAALATRGSAPR